jgi:ribosomal protein L25 (general stress protein Ctc)
MERYGTMNTSARTARNARSTPATAVSPGTKNARLELKKNAIQMAAYDVINLKLSGQTYGAIPKIICRYKDITTEQIKRAVRIIEELEAPMDELAPPNAIIDCYIFLNPCNILVLVHLIVIYPQSSRYPWSSLYPSSS